VDHVIDWLNDNSGVVEAISVALLVVVTAVYACATARMAKASRAIADATLRPAIFHWISGQPVPTDGEETVSVNYQNVGSGPAANIHWLLDPVIAGQITVTPRRVMMNVGEKSEGSLGTKLKFPLPDGGVFVVARYGDLTGTTWESRLNLVMENGNLGNGKHTCRRV